MSRTSDNPYEIGQWSDFVRGLVDVETERAMEQVLDSSEEARSQVAALERVADLSAAERASTPPAWAVRCAKALGSLHRPAVDDVPAAPLWKRIALQLTFDSSTSPALAGTRDALGDERQMVFEQDDYRVDLRLEPEYDMRQSVLVGQLMQIADEIAPVADVPVLAIRPGTETEGPGAREIVLASTQTSEFGEFQAAELPAGPLALLLMVGDERCLQLDFTNAPPTDEEFGGPS